MSWRQAACVAVTLAALGCGDEDHALYVPCAPMDLCAAVPLDRVTATCGTGATTATVDGGIIGGNTIDICDYDAPTGVGAFSIMRSCFELGSSAAISYGTTHDDLQPGFAREEVPDLGDSAFFRVNIAEMRGQFFVLNANVFLALTNFEVGDAESARSCMATLAGDVLAAQ